ncbi:MAG: CcmD family protein [Vicinamibacterales bacterium]
MMTSLRRVAPLVALVGLLAGAAVAVAQPAQPPRQMDEFVPIDELPQQEQIPAANLLIPAYAFVWVAVLVYVVSIARRLNGVQREVERLEADIKARK